MSMSTHMYGYYDTRSRPLNKYDTRSDDNNGYF